MKRRSQAELLTEFARVLSDDPKNLGAAVEAIHRLGLADAEPGLREQRGAELAEAAERSRERSKELLTQRWWHVLEAAAERHGVTVDLMLNGNREGLRGGPWSSALHESMFVLRHGAKLSYPVIGMLVERDHSTALDGVRKIEQLAASQPGLRERLLATAVPAPKSVAA